MNNRPFQVDRKHKNGRFYLTEIGDNFSIVIANGEEKNADPYNGRCGVKL